MRKIVSCGVLIFRGSPIEDFLLMQHSDRLDLPKGHVDPGETEIECALREMEEETGIQPCDVELDPDFRFEHHYRVWPPKFDGEECEKTLIIFLARLLNPIKIRPTEHLGYAWHHWQPPHRIQEQTIDPLLQQLADFWRQN